MSNNVQDMSKILSPSLQVRLLRSLRRMCPFAVWSGQYGYTCGGMTGGVRASTGMGARSKECRHCRLTCTSLRRRAFIQGYEITLPISKLAAL